MPGYPAMPGYPVVPGAPAVPGAPGMPPTPPTTPPPVTDPGTGVSAPAPGTVPGFESRLTGSGLGESVALGLGGYIDNAVPVSQLVMRYDAAYRSNRPDRAEFFYAKCGCFLTLDSRGPPLPERTVDYQEITPYLEYAFTPRFSAFASVPVRFINPDVNANETGLSDVSFGTKYAVVYDPTRVVTLQVRAITPTGGTREGLGTGNWWIEPGLLWLEQFTPRLQLFGQVKDQIYLTRQSDFTGNVLSYGLGTSYMAAYGRWGYVAPVAEFVGWTVLGGKELADGQAVSARGATIVNAKLGARIGFGPTCPGQFLPTRSDLYLGYGRALTGEVWYTDIVRVEYRMRF
jgi:hypothetical protein